MLKDVPRSRIESVEFLRGIAAFSVAWFHFTNGGSLLPDGWLKTSGSQGNLGVPVFFVISGCIIPYSMYKAGFRFPANVPTFLLKRLLRLEPPYLVAVVLEGHQMTRLIAPFFLLMSIAAVAAPTVDVASRASSGSGSAFDPWRGWDVTTVWIEETEYFFKSGYYAYSTSPNFLRTGIALRGEAGTVLMFTGFGNAVVFDNPGILSPPYKNWTQNVRMENFIIQGNPNATNGLFLRGVRNGIFRHISVRDVANSGVWAEALVTNIFDNIRVSHHEMPEDRFNVVPRYGIVLGTRGPVDSTTTTTVTNAVIEGVSQIGIWIREGSFSNTFINGTSEGNAGKGMVIDGLSNTVINMDFESNGGTDVEINGGMNHLQGVVSAGLVDLRFGNLNKVRGTLAHVRVISADYTDLSGSYISSSLDDGNKTTIKFGYNLKGEFRNDSIVGNVIGVMIPLPVVAGAVVTDARQSSLFSVMLTADTTLANPTNGADGQRITWRFQQDIAGGHVLSFGSLFELQGGQVLAALPQSVFNPQARGARPPTLNSASLSFTEISARFNTAANKWQIQ